MTRQELSIVFHFRAVQLLTRVKAYVVWVIIGFSSRGQVVTQSFFLVLGLDQSRLRNVFFVLVSVSFVNVLRSEVEVVVMVSRLRELLGLPGA